MNVIDLLYFILNRLTVYQERVGATHRDQRHGDYELGGHVDCTNIQISTAEHTRLSGCSERISPRLYTKKRVPPLLRS